jgi:hypothetical protein
MSSRTTEGIQKFDIERRAVDRSGRLGSLYNQYRDQIQEKINSKTKKPKVRKPKTAHCKLIFGRTVNSENLLQMIGIQDDLRLSILLDLIPRTEIASIIDHSHRINEYTRFLHYIYIRKIEYLSDEEQVRKEIQSSTSKTDATHFITGVRWGIEFVVVLQLPSVDQTAKEIDIILNSLCSKLTKTCRKRNPSKLTPKEENILKEIASTKVFSSMPALASMKTIRDIYLNIHRFEKDKNGRQPIEYELCSIQEVHLISNNNENILKSRYETCKKEIEHYLVQLSNSSSYVQSFLTNNVSHSLQGHLKGQYNEANVKWLNVKTRYDDEIKGWTKLVNDMRRNLAQISQIEEALNNEQQKALRRDMEELINDIKHLEAKEQFINDLQQKQFQFYYVTKDDVSSIDDVQTVVGKLIKDDELARVLCSSDILNKNELLQFTHLRDLLVEEHQNNPNLRLIYADFSSCSFKLPTIICFPKDSMGQHIISQESMEPQTSDVPPSDDVVNILLLGESGVGKSTFINAFVNYLTFETMKGAEENKPVVLIPVSFMITVGDNFEEHIVKFGEFDKTNNEDFDHPGQSVTQRCKSYVFNLHHLHGKKLRIIDTPGFGDTRGLDQDDLNMEHILTYVNNLTHLNAVCFLLKPNASQLTNFFRTCLSQLCDLLGPNACQNIIFCFTNARTTFYNPGDTAPLLRAMLNSFPVKDIPFAKMNTFCFDNESFRYLVALQNSIQFSELDRDEYEKSWSISVKESKRLLDYICKNLPMCHIDEQRKSIKHAQIEIVCMIRPMLEAMRNTLRDIVPQNNDEKKKSIVSSLGVVNRPTSVLLSCEHQTDQLNRFSISSDIPYGNLKKNPTCKCISNQQMPIDHRHMILDKTANHSIDEMAGQLSSLFDACIEFAQFLMNTDHSSKKSDPFLIGLTRMIEDEKKNCLNNNSKLILSERLLNEYERRMNEMKSNKNSIDLPVIYERITIIRNYPGVHEQMNDVKQVQQNMMKYYEYEVPDSLTDTSDILITVF